MNSVYAFGDVHGCLDELKELHALVEQDRDGAPSTYVFLGDYIDRGPDSAGVVQFLIDASSGEDDTRPAYVFIRGNHEQMMRDAEYGEDRDAVYIWMSNGGVETQKSYFDGRYDHSDFYKRLRWYHSIGDVAFVHAGIDPEKSLEDQSNNTLIWSREFNRYNGTFKDNRYVVHGHSPVPDVYRLNNQINIDTGCVFGQDFSEDYGKLTALKITSESGSFANDGTLKFKAFSVRRKYS